MRKASTGNVVFIGPRHDIIPFPHRLFRAVMKSGKLPIKDYILLATWTLAGQFQLPCVDQAILSFKRGRTILIGCPKVRCLQGNLWNHKLTKTVQAGHWTNSCSTQRKSGYATSHNVQSLILVVLRSYSWNFVCYLYSQNHPCYPILLSDTFIQSKNGTG